MRAEMTWTWADPDWIGIVANLPNLLTARIVEDPRGFESWTVSLEGRVIQKGTTRGVESAQAMAEAAVYDAAQKDPAYQGKVRTREGEAEGP